MSNHLRFRNIDSARKGQNLSKTVILLLNGDRIIAPIRLDPGCDAFGKTMFRQGGNIPVMHDYTRKTWVEYSIEGV